MVKSRVENETKDARFKRIASTRTTAVLEKLRILGNCANRSVYEYSGRDVERIFDALEQELGRIKHKFERRKEKRVFRL